jgi:hypothetical protein
MHLTPWWSPRLGKSSSMPSWTPSTGPAECLQYKTEGGSAVPTPARWRPRPGSCPRLFARPMRHKPAVRSPAPLVVTRRLHALDLRPRAKHPSPSRRTGRTPRAPGQLNRYESDRGARRCLAPLSRSAAHMLRPSDPEPVTPWPVSPTRTYRTSRQTGPGRALGAGRPA